MDITIYLPDELASRAKADPDVNLSRMLRDALIAHYQEVDAVEQTLVDAKEVVLDLEDQEGRAYKGRIRGTRITASENPEVYLDEEGKVIVYDPNKARFWIDEDPEENLREQLGSDEYIEAMHALGIVPTVDLMATGG